ncbi:beta-propeller fold lactonase family protein [bacterium]|nr:beta-propeller fold lactonase family protein [bacterium]
MKQNILLLFFLLASASCSDDKKSGRTDLPFPDGIDSIFLKSCATAGCHLPDEHAGKILGSQHLPADLDLSSWTSLFRGSAHGAVVIPFNAARSHLIEHVTGLRSPRMPPNYSPYNRDTLTWSQINALTSWVDEGAPNSDNDIPFEHATKKIFTTNQGVDVVSVIDENSLLEMRVFEVGDRQETESPHGVEVSSDGKYFYVSMIATGDVFKYDAANGSFLDKLSLSDPIALIKLSKDNLKLYVTTNFQVNNTGQNGFVSVIRTSDMGLIKQIPVGISPHGINLSRDGKLLYVTAVYSDRLYVIDTQTDSAVTFFDVAGDVGPQPKYEPYHIGLSPAGSQGYENYLFVTCRSNGQVRIFQRTVASNHNSFTFIDSVMVGSNTESRPIQLDVSPNGQYIYTANSNDSSVTVIQNNGTDFTFLTNITKQMDPHSGEEHRLSQPNGVAFSKDGKYVYVSNRNKNGAVPPHHGGTGGPGLLSVIDVATNTIIKTIELQPDCYSVFVSN